jgi:hypothetical protein
MPTLDCQWVVRRSCERLAGYPECPPASCSVARLPATYPAGTLQSPCFLQPCWTAILNSLRLPRVNVPDVQIDTPARPVSDRGRREPF